MGVDTLRTACAGYRQVFLDTMIFSYHFLDHPRYAPLTEVVLALIESGQISAWTTTLTLAELLVVPMRADDRQAMRDYELYLTNFPHLTLVQLDISLARQAARVRATTGLRMPDAIQIAAASLYNVDAIVTNDLRWRDKTSSLALLLLDEYVN